MLCEKCGNDLKVIGFHYKITGDESENEKTRLFIVQSFECRNRACESYGKTVETETEEKI